MDQYRQLRLIPFGTTPSAWSVSNPIPKQGELVYEIGSPMQMKIGDGITPYMGLPYITGGGATPGDGTYLGVAILTTNPGTVTVASFYYTQTVGTYVNFPTGSGAAVMPTGAILGILSYNVSTGFWVYRTLIGPTSSSIPTIEAVLLAGNITDQELIFQNTSGNTLSLQSTLLAIIAQASSGNLTQVRLTGAQIEFYQEIASAILTHNIQWNTLTANRVLKMQDASGTNALTDPRVETSASYTTSHAINSDNFDWSVQTAQSGAFKYLNPTGTPVNRRCLVTSIKDNGTPVAITYDTKFVGGVTTPLTITTIASKNLIQEWVYFAEDTLWHLLGINQE